MENYMVQVVIPVYNAEKTLRKCLDSLKNQTFQNWQAIVVDDASTDNSVKIIEEYAEADSRFVCVKREKNGGGASKTRNTALRQLNAEYTAFLDSDDYWEQEMLAVLTSKAKEFDCDVVQCRFIYDFPNGKQVLPKGAFPENIYLEGKGLKKVFTRMMTGINMNHVCMKLIRTSLLRGLTFDTSLQTAEDLEFCIRLFGGVKRYYFTTDVLYHYCRNDESLTGKGLPFVKRFAANREVARRMVKALPAWDMDCAFYKFLSFARPYIIIASKIFRIIREKLVK